MRLQEPTGDLTGVAETLTITLYARAIETQRPEPMGERSRSVCKAQSPRANLS